jgi:hypothetical protein
MEMEYAAPAEFANFIYRRAGQISTRMSTVTDKQREVQKQTMLRDLDRVAQSETFTAVQADYALFGRKIFDRKSQE